MWRETSKQLAVSRGQRSGVRGDFQGDAARAAHSAALQGDPPTLISFLLR